MYLGSDIALEWLTRSSDTAQPSRVGRRGGERAPACDLDEKQNEVSSHFGDSEPKRAGSVYVRIDWPCSATRRRLHPHIKVPGNASKSSCFRAHPEAPVSVQSQPLLRLTENLWVSVGFLVAESRGRQHAGTS